MARLELELWVEPEKLLDCLAVNRFQKACDRGGDCQSKVVRLVRERAREPVPPIPRAWNSVMVAIRIALASASIEAVAYDIRAL